MSAKKTVSKKAVPVKKAPAKKKVPVKKKVEKKAPAKKAIPAKKNAEPKKKPVAKKIVVKKVPAKKPANAAPAKKTPAKAMSKKNTAPKRNDLGKKKVATAKPATKPKPVKHVPEKPVSKTAAKREHTKTVVEEKPMDVKEVKETKPIKSTKAVPDSKAEEPEAIISVLLDGDKTLLKTPFFLEVDEQEDRTNKKKVSSELKGLEKPTLVMRRKASLAEETPEELYNRVIQELEEENQNLYKESEDQLCTKCGIRPVVAEYRVDKDLGYCEECAKMLGLGHTKEARRLDYQMNLMGGDSLSEGEDELADAAPTAEDLADPDLDIDDGKDL